MKRFKWLMVGLVLLVGAVYAAQNSANYLQRLAPGGVQVHLIESDGTQTQKGSLKFGDDSSVPSLPTSTNAAQFSVKVPYYNNSGGTIAQGSIVLIDVLGGTSFYGKTAAVFSTTTLMGVADASCASAVDCYMTVAGYALVLTSGTVNSGDFIVTTSTAAGYGMKPITATVGTILGRAVGAGTAAGGLTPVLVDMQ